MGRRDYATVGSAEGGDGVEDGVAMTHSNFRDDMIHGRVPSQTSLRQTLFAGGK